MEHTITFVGRLVVGIVFVRRMVDKVVVAMMVVDKMVWFTKKVDFGQHKWVELLLGWRWMLNS